MWVSGEALSKMQRDIIRLNDELEKNKRISHELITGLIEKVLFDPETMRKEIQSAKELDREIYKIITEETEGEGEKRTNMDIQKIEQVINMQADELILLMEERKARNMKWIDEKRTEAIKALTLLMMVTEMIKLNENPIEHTL